MHLDEAITKMCDVMRERTGSIQDTATFTNTLDDDSPVVKQYIDDHLRGRVEMSIIDQQDGRYLLNVALHGSNARPGRIFLDKKSVQFSGRMPPPTKPEYRLIRAATGILYRDIQNT